jgi:two-component system C4-dicarboxylate transport response regulator DctD
MTDERRILIIDDDLKRIRSVIEMLQMEGYEVHHCSTAASALNVIQSDLPGFLLVILELQMPCGPYSPEESSYGRRTGAVILKSLRDQNKDIPVVVFSVVRDSSTKQEILSMGRVRYIEKPCFPSVLVETVEELIKRQ